MEARRGRFGVPTSPRSRPCPPSSRQRVVYQVDRFADAAWIHGHGGFCNATSCDGIWRLDHDVAAGVKTASRCDRIGNLEWQLLLQLASALAKAASASGAPLTKSAISKTVASVPGLTCARLALPFSKGNAAANDEASFIACRRLTKCISTVSCSPSLLPSSALCQVLLCANVYAGSGHAISVGCPWFR
jgi:hypothetical protein